MLETNAVTFLYPWELGSACRLSGDAFTQEVKEPKPPHTALSHHPGVWLLHSTRGQWRTGLSQGTCCLRGQATIHTSLGWQLSPWACMAQM